MCYQVGAGKKRVIRPLHGPLTFLSSVETTRGTLRLQTNDLPSLDYRVTWLLSFKKGHVFFRNNLCGKVTTGDVSKPYFLNNIYVYHIPAICFDMLSLFLSCQEKVNAFSNKHLLSQLCLNLVSKVMNELLYASACSNTSHLSKMCFVLTK